MQQTRVNQGLDYYLKFSETFPTIFSLAGADPEKVMKLWQGLGYYSRARNLHTAARQVVEDHQGIFPTTYESLLTLKGVGEYTAAAIASISFNEPVAVVDGNVARVLSRLFAVDVPVNTGAGHKIIKNLADEMLNHKSPGQYNQAIMEFGALQCTPGKPDCRNCPLHDVCEAFKNDQVNAYPYKVKKVNPRKRFFTYFIFNDGGITFLQKRTGKDIWQELYDFPLIESKAELLSEELPGIISNTYRAGKEVFNITHISSKVKHQLTHQTIYCRFVHVEMKDRKYIHGEHWIPIPFSEVSDYPLPRLIDRYLESVFD